MTGVFRFAFSVLAVLTVLAPAGAQKRVAPTKELDFAEALEAAKKAHDAGDFGGAVSALQAALRTVQKKQRAAVLAVLPKPAGYEIRDDDAPDQGLEAFNAGVAMLGHEIRRHYQKGDVGIDVEIMANSPLVQMMSMLLSNPALVTQDGGEVVEYGAHKAILKKQDDGQVELSILMHNKHLVKVTSQGLSVDDLLAIFDQAFVDALEKPLGK